MASKGHFLSSAPRWRPWEKTVHMIQPLRPQGKHGWTSKFMASASPIAAHCSHLGNELSNEKSLSLQLRIPNKYIFGKKNVEVAKGDQIKFNFLKAFSVLKWSNYAAIKCRELTENQCMMNQAKTSMLVIILSSNPGLSMLPRNYFNFFKLS